MDHSRKKSPRFPSLSLGDALEKVQRVYSQQRLAAAVTDVVAQHLGYKSANSGSALQTMASLRYFGLVDRPKDGYLAVSKDYETYQYAPDACLRHALLTQFLKTPPLYADLLDEYLGELPADANLRYDLIQRGFSPTSAGAALTCFRRSVEFVRQAESSSEAPTPYSSEPTEDAGSSVESSPAHDPIGEAQPVVFRGVGVDKSIEPRPQGPDGAGARGTTFDQIPVRLSGGRRAELWIPVPLYQADKARLKAQIDLLLAQDEEDGV